MHFAAKADIHGASLLALLFVFNASPQLLSQSLGEGGRRFNYPTETFSIALPTAWGEIDSVTLSQMVGTVQKAVPNAVELKKLQFSHGYRPATGGAAYPWVAIILTGEPVPEAAFENMAHVYSTVDAFNEKWQAPVAGNALQKAQMNTMFYDKARHVLWGVSQSTFSGAGDLQTLSAAYMTKAGSVQVHCYSKADEFQKYQPLCRQIIESVVIDPRVALTK